MMCTTQSAPVLIRAIPTYRPGEPNRCPGCGHSNWLVGRSTAQCGFCATAMPIASRDVRSFDPEMV